MVSPRHNLSFWKLALRNFLGYFVFFVTPTAATDYWNSLLLGDPSTKISDSERSLRQRAFWVGMGAGPVLLFALSLLFVGIYLDYL